MLLALAAVVLQTVVGWIVAIRLLRLASRTRELPERLLGLSLLLAVALGYPFRVAGPLLASPVIDWLGNALVSGGFCMVAVFVRRVFRPEERWALRLSVLLAVGYGAQSALCWGERAMPATFWQMVLASITYGWAALEAGTRARMQRRQLAIGLGDASVCDRLRLFTALAICVVCGAATNAGAIAAGLVPLEEPLVLIATTLSGTTLAITAWLAFAPPAFYRRRFERAAA